MPAVPPGTVMPTVPRIEEPMVVVYTGRLTGNFNLTGKITGMNYRVMANGMAFTVDARDFEFMTGCGVYRRVVK